MKNLITCSLAVILTSCSSMQESVGLGAAIGGTGGALIGNQEGKGSHRDKSTLQGAAIGAALGALIGYAGHKGKEQKKGPGKEVRIGENIPYLSAPKVRRIWVPARIEGEKYIDGHYMYVIEKTSQWSD